MSFETNHVFLLFYNHLYFIWYFLAETVFRDRSSGRTRNLKMEKLKKREEEQKKAEEDEKFMQWGKG